MTDRPIFEAMEECRTSRDDLQRAVSSTFDGILARYAAQISPDSLLGRLADADLPTVDFDAWYSGIRTRQAGSLGSGTLSWPLLRSERVAMQRQLILRMQGGSPTLFELGYHFFRSTRLSEQIRDVVAQIVEPFHRDFVTMLNPHVQSERIQVSGSAVKLGRSLPKTDFIGRERIRALEELNGRSAFDLRKTIAICHELNSAWSADAWFSVAFLTRCLLDHVPPAFGRLTFAEVASQEPGKSFKEACQALDAMARKIADAHLHSVMKRHDVIPNAQQVNSSQALDVLLAETISRLEQGAGKPSLPAANTP